jgi:hypothetical protein
MDVPPISHPAWSNIVSGKKTFQFEFLATNFLLNYLAIKLRDNPSPQKVQKCAQELRELFVRNANLYCVQRDLFQIFGKDKLSGYMHDVSEVKEKIARGRKLLLAGDEELLKQLPAGAWIGGSIPYFMTEQGGLVTRNKIYVTEMPEDVFEISIKTYNVETLPSVYADMAENGFSLIVIPASSRTHLEFALHAPQYKGFAHRPLIGWIAGVHLDDLGQITPKVFNGQTQAVLEDGAVVMHAVLPPTQVAEINYINIFEQGDGDTITFSEDGFNIREAYINGVRTNFAEYVTRKNLDTRLPLVADYYGSMVNVSFQGVNKAKQEVQLYAPVFAGVPYKHAKPLEDYVKQFTSKIPTHLNRNPAFSCNCILNYLYSELEGKRTGEITGPTTFGEIVYQLLNQTMAYMTITDLSVH